MGVFIYRSNNGTSEGRKQAAVVEVVESGKGAAIKLAMAFQPLVNNA